MKRIFILNDRVVGGGAEIVMRDIINRLANNHEITLMTMDDDGAAAKRVFGDKVRYVPSKIIENPYGIKNPLYYLIAVYNKLRIAAIQRGKYDIAIANKEGPSMKIVSKMTANRKIAWVHVDYQLLYWTGAYFKEGGELECMRMFDSVVCVSRSSVESVKKVVGDPGNLCVKYNPIDYKRILEMSKDGGVERDPSKPLFVAVGRLDKQKNFRALAKACARLGREFDFEVWLIGDGEERESIEEILENEGCDCLKLLGMQENPYKYLSKADLFVSTSLGESYGLAIQEALILGVPVLSTKCPAIEESLDTSMGMIVDCSEEAVEKGMRRVLENPDRIEQYRKNIEEGYDTCALWDERLSEIERLILEG